MKWIKALLTLLVFQVAALARRAKTYKGKLDKLNQWYRLPIEGAVTSTGAQYHAYIKKGKLNKLVFHFAGGGGSWCEETAPPATLLGALSGGDAGYYFPEDWRLLEAALSGMLAADDPKNPFNDWCFIQLPYATADFHTGDNAFPYTGKNGKPGILQHKGEVNLSLALQQLAPLFPDVSDLLVSGESAGAFACVAQADKVAACWPGCERITVFADCAQMYYPKWKQVLREVWHAREELVEAAGDEGELIRGWFTRLSGRLGPSAQF